MEQIDVLLRPVITEKSMREAGFNRFTFAVARLSTKPEIKQAIEKQFKVKVVDIKTLTTRGKKKRAGKARREILVEPVKKAIVQLVSGQKIDLFEVAESGKKT